MQGKKNKTAEDNARLDLLIGVKGSKRGDATSEAAYFSGIEKQLVLLLQNSLKNAIAQKFIDILSDERNRKWMELPIVMERLKTLGAPKGVEKSPLQILQDYGINLYPDHTLSFATTQNEIHKNTFSGASLTGAAANAVKVIAYLFKAAPYGDNVLVSKNNELNLFGKK